MGIEHFPPTSGSGQTSLDVAVTARSCRAVIERMNMHEAFYTPLSSTQHYQQEHAVLGKAKRLRSGRILPKQCKH